MANSSPILRVLYAQFIRRGLAQTEVDRTVVRQAYDLNAGRLLRKEVDVQDLTDEIMGAALTAYDQFGISSLVGKAEALESYTHLIASVHDSYLTDLPPPRSLSISATPD